MNRPIRRVAIVALLLMFALLVNVNWVQAFQAHSLNARPDNSRSRTEAYARERGAVLVQGRAVARSVATTDTLKYLRRYPGGAEYAAATGYDSVVYGSNGIERSQNDYLSGQNDQLFVRRVVDLVQGQQPSGASVELTLQSKLQDAAWQAMQGKKGGVVALDPQTGAVLAMVSTPSYDPATLSTHDLTATRKAKLALDADPDRPLASRASYQLYPPGSTFKLVTAAAALATGNYQPSTVVPAPDTLTLPGVSQPLRNDAGESCAPDGRSTLSDALKISCNTAFAQLGLTLGNQALARTAQQFGFGSQILPSVQGSTSRFSTGADQPGTAQAAIGQFNDRASVAQMASVAATIADGGVRHEPYLVQRILGPDLSTISAHDAGDGKRVMTTANASALSQMMVGVVQGGTGTAAQIDGVQVAGKTGTAQIGRADGGTIAWFVAFAPAQRPTVAVAVAIEDAGLAQNTDLYGGRVAAPIARSVLQAALQ